MKRELTNRFLEVLNEYHALGIAEQIDYPKFYLYSLITHSTAIEGSTVTEVENQLLFDEGITAKGRTLQEQMMNLDLKAAYEHSVTIHPWADGNGRMSRLVMNHLQYEFGLVPVKVVKEDKADYIQALIETRRQESLEPFREFMLEEHIRNLSKEIGEYKQSQNNDPINATSDPINATSDPINAFTDPIKQRLYQEVLRDGSLNYAGYAALLGVSEATVKRRLNELKKEGAIVRIGSNKAGHWEIKE